MVRSIISCDGERMIDVEVVCHTWRWRPGRLCDTRHDGHPYRRL